MNKHKHELHCSTFIVTSSKNISTTHTKGTNSKRREFGSLRWYCFTYWSVILLNLTKTWSALLSVHRDFAEYHLDNSHKGEGRAVKEGNMAANFFHQNNWLSWRRGGRDDHAKQVRQAVRPPPVYEAAATGVPMRGRTARRRLREGRKDLLGMMCARTNETDAAKLQRLKMKDAQRNASGNG